MPNENEIEFMNQVAKYLKEIGCSIVEEDVRWDRTKHADLVGYTIDSTGKKNVAVVFEVKSKATVEPQKNLLLAAKSFGAKYALLTVKDMDNGWSRYWFDVNTSLPLQNEPQLEKKYFIEDTKGIEEQLYKVVNNVRSTLYGAVDIVEFLGDLLLVRTYLNETNQLNKWEDFVNNRSNFRAETYKHFKMKLTETSLYTRISDSQLYRIIEDLSVVSPQKSSVGTAFLKVITSLIEKGGDGQFLTGEHVRNIFKRIALALGTSGKLADISSGFGTILSELVSNIPFESAVGFEVNTSVAKTSQIFLIISGHNQARIESKDSLSLGEHHHGFYDLVIVDPPLGLSASKIDRASLEKSRIASKSNSVRTSDLMLEQAIRISKKNGHIIALVPEITLSSSGASREVRELIKDDTIIEAIISLPPHILKPLTMAKVSILVLRKKNARDEKAEDVFLAKLDSIDEINELIEKFQLFRKERSL